MKLINRLFDFLKYPAVQIALIIILVCWCLGTLFLLQQNQTVKHKLTKEQNENLALMKQLNELTKKHRDFLDELEGSTFPIVTLNTINPNDNTAIKTQFNKDMIVVLFTHFGCGSCLTTTLREVDSFYRDYRKNVDVIGIYRLGDDPINIWKQTRVLASYPIFLDELNTESVFNKLNIEETPLILYVSGTRNKIIHAAPGTNDEEALMQELDKIRRFCQ